MRRATPKQISQALMNEGIDVLPRYVSQIKHLLKTKKKRRKKKAALAGATSEAAAPAAAADHAITYADLTAAKALVDRLGDVKTAQAALDALETLR